MQYTTHYNLMLPEGTDIVNPLVQQNPNFSAIDVAMYANKQGLVGSATELTAGTVHTITRANTDSNVIKFTATSNWTAGDSMVIDSTPVSVFLTDGTTPATGAYTINSEVLLILNGTRVTLIASASTPNASGVFYNNAGSGLTASNVQGAIDGLASEAPWGYVEIIADGVKSYGQIFEGLYALVDLTKITRYSMLKYGGTYIPLGSNNSNRLTFAGGDSVITGGVDYRYVARVYTSSFFRHIITNLDGSVLNNDATNDIPTSGTSFRVIY